VDKASIPWLVALWALNPMVFAISTRGNAESLVALFVLLTLYGLHTDAIVLAAVSFGLAVHIKPFPILYALPMYFFIETPQGGDGLLQRLFALKRVKFALVSGGTFLALGAAMYHLYRPPFHGPKHPTLNVCAGTDGSSLSRRTSTTSCARTIGTISPSTFT